MTLEFLRYLTRADVDLLLDKANRLTYAAGEQVLAQGAPIPGIYVIRRGQVRIERADEGAAIPLAKLNVGEIFGEMSLLESEPASASVVAAEELEVDLIPGEHVTSLLISVPGFATRFYKSLAIILSHRLRETSSVAFPFFRL
jgi:CRP-like cAMP-binding protein